MKNEEFTKKRVQKTKIIPTTQCEDDLLYIEIWCILFHHFPCGSVTHLEDVQPFLWSS
jgi:hypothetical protein